MPFLSHRMAQVASSESICPVCPLRNRSPYSDPAGTESPSRSMGNYRVRLPKFLKNLAGHDRKGTFRTPDVSRGDWGLRTGDPGHRRNQPPTPRPSMNQTLMSSRLLALAKLHGPGVTGSSGIPLGSTPRPGAPNA